MHTPNTVIVQVPLKLAFKMQVIPSDFVGVILSCQAFEGLSWWLALFPLFLLTLSEQSRW